MSMWTVAGVGAHPHTWCVFAGWRLCSSVAWRPLADRDRMFAPFERLSATRGTARVGLGLTLARGLTQAMRGALEPEKRQAAA